MKYQLRYATLVLSVVYLISCYLTFWVEISWAIHLFLYLPIAIGFSVILLGTNLINKFDFIIRAISTIFLTIGLGYSFYLLSCSAGGLAALPILFIGSSLLSLIFLLYVILLLIQLVKKT